jgi:hypothetical protein
VKRVLEIKHPWKGSAAYSLIIPDSTFTDMLGNSHDTIVHNFSSKNIEDYGNLYLEIKCRENVRNHIVQLMKDNKTIAEFSLQKNQKVSFSYLQPGSYRVKVIFDRNGNGKWDTGDYIYGIQPEEVDFFPKEISVRANWDILEEWDLQIKE